MTTDNTKYWLTLIRTPGIGSAKYRKLIRSIGNIKNLLTASAKELQQLGFTKNSIDTLLHPRWDLVEKDIEWLKNPNHHLLTIENPIFPTLLKEIPDPPLALFIKGSPQALNLPQIAIVGSRQPSNTGLDNAFDFANFLAKFGLIITSGLAIGIDTASHKGALAANGKTIAVMGTGLNKIYPASNKTLANNIVKKGGILVSEFPLDSFPNPKHFPQRNRIISGLSLGTIVVEATTRSGSLITARMACEQNREVFALPGTPRNPLSRGCHKLIKQGAHLVETPQDVLDEIDTLLSAVSMYSLDSGVRGNDGKTSESTVERKVPLERTNTNASNLNLIGNITKDFCQNTDQSKKNKNNALAPEHKKLLQYVGNEPTPIDLLIEKSGLPVDYISGVLLILELQGYIKSNVGGYVVRQENERDF